MSMRDHISLNHWWLLLKLIQRFDHFLEMGLGSENNKLLRDRDDNSDIDLDGLSF